MALLYSFSSKFVVPSFEIKNNKKVQVILIVNKNEHVDKLHCRVIGSVQHVGILSTS